MLKLILAAVVLLSIAFAGIAIRLFFFKDAGFRKSCSSIDPRSGQPLGCSCGSNANTACENVNH